MVRIELSRLGTVPTNTRAAHWAGSPDQRRLIHRMVRGWQRRPISEINVILADFGQGKSHSLLYAQHLLRSVDSDAIAHYVQLPPLTTSSPFVALYRQIMQEFPLDALARRVFDQFKNAPMTLFAEPHPTRRAIQQLLWLIATHAHGNELAHRWLRAEPVSGHELSGLVIGDRPIHLSPVPQQAQDCQNVMVSLLTIATLGPQGKRTQCVLLIDEFQRVGELTLKKRSEVCSAIHLIFNAHPEHLKIVLAFAGDLPEMIETVLTQDLLARVRLRIDFPHIGIEAGRQYLLELFSDLNGEMEGRSPAGTISIAEDAFNFMLVTAGRPNHIWSPRKINIAFDLITSAVIDDREENGKNIEVDITIAEARAAALSIDPRLLKDLSATSDGLDGTADA